MKMMIFGKTTSKLIVRLSRNLSMAFATSFAADDNNRYAAQRGIFKYYFC